MLNAAEKNDCLQNECLKMPKVVMNETTKQLLKRILKRETEITPENPTSKRKLKNKWEIEK